MVHRWAPEGLSSPTLISVGVDELRKAGQDMLQAKGVGAAGRYALPPATPDASSDGIRPTLGSVPRALSEVPRGVQSCRDVFQPADAPGACSFVEVPERPKAAVLLLGDEKRTA